MNRTRSQQQASVIGPKRFHYVISPGCIAGQRQKPASSIDHYWSIKAPLTRPFMSPEKPMVKVLCVLYDDPVSGHPKSYARDGIPEVEHYPGGQTTPSPKLIDFKPGELLG